MDDLISGALTGLCRLQWHWEWGRDDYITEKYKLKKVLILFFGFFFFGTNETKRFLFA